MTTQVRAIILRPGAKADSKRRLGEVFGIVNDSLTVGYGVS